MFVKENPDRKKKKKVCPMKTARSWSHVSWVINEEIYTKETLDSPSKNSEKK